MAALTEDERAQVMRAMALLAEAATRRREAEQGSTPAVPVAKSVTNSPAV
jgi:hypothetical protein